MFEKFKGEIGFKLAFPSDLKSCQGHHLRLRISKPCRVGIAAYASS